ncbi:hydroxyacylglutathione hydrolase [Chitinilyticum piscinae]|uniref:Hydroxyacylglutathione hydrolase n=1 Tax=Chitinilyticum piscinae TaxID=2866724 RepID=A0A8J7FQL7_9NEIS|nr:hydroxyacylglutathione hydrolase [Chitinilyticum piscinae]MBE9608916.1 hydroxyacylglutathione hydrolase [Chitinilyticum piscinae]
MLTVSAVPAFTDNYIWVLHKHRQAIAVDPGDAETLLDWLTQHQLTLNAVLVTHRHADHIGGLARLQQHYPALTIHGPQGIPGITHALHDGEALDCLGLEMRAIHTPGHTREHLCFYGDEMLFCGDTLFGAGCGRMLDGPMPDAFHQSLQRLAQLPPNTRIHCAHEYTLNNLHFARNAEPNNPLILARLATVSAQRAQARPSLPSRLADELATNPFLRLESPSIQQQLRQRGIADSDPAALFAALRQWKDHFS